MKGVLSLPSDLIKTLADNEFGPLDSEQMEVCYEALLKLQGRYEDAGYLTEYVHATTQRLTVLGLSASQAMGYALLSASKAASIRIAAGEHKPVEVAGQQVNPRSTNAGIAPAANRGADGFYDPQRWRQNYDDFYSGNVTSTTVPPYSAKNVQLAGQRHPETGVVFDQRGFPIFDNHSAYDTRFTGADFQNASYQTQMRMATRDLRSQIQANLQLRSQFNDAQLSAIQGGNAKIPDFTWHHHQDRGRMQLVRENIHRQTGHVGGEAMSGGQ